MIYIIKPNISLWISLNTYELAFLFTRDTWMPL